MPQDGQRTARRRWRSIKGLIAGSSILSCSLTVSAGRSLDRLRQSTQLLGEPERCVHIGDRESDIYELFCTAQELGTHFPVRACVDRLAGDGQHTIADELKEVKVKGRHQVEVRSRNGEVSHAVVELRYRRIQVLPPIGKQKRYPALSLTVIHARERRKPRNRASIDWKLITDLPVRSRAEAVEKLRWYAMRWKVELFHKILKSGRRAEDARLRTAERLVNLLSLFCILSWRIFWMTMLNRVVPDESPRLARRLSKSTCLTRWRRIRARGHGGERRSRTI